LAATCRFAIDRYWNSSPAMADLLCDLLAGVSVEQLRRVRRQSCARSNDTACVSLARMMAARDTTSEGERIESLACAALVA
jgi:hypothetical protein